MNSRLLILDTAGQCINKFISNHVCGFILFHLSSTTSRILGICSNMDSRQESGISLNDILEAINGVKTRLDSLGDRVSSLESKSKNQSPTGTPLGSPRGSKNDDAKNTSSKDGLHFDETAPSDHSKQGRRSSMYDKMEPVTGQAVTTMRTQPDYSHITLKRIALWPSIQFLRQVLEYHDRNNLEIQNVGSLLSAEASKDLVAIFYSELTSASVGKLTFEKMGKYLQKACQPNCTIQFIDYLNRYVDFELPEKYSPNVLGYPKFRQALLKLREDYMYFFLFMSTMNHSGNIPELSNKKGGLIKIFLDKIPFDYGQNLYQDLKVKNFNDLSDFMDKFYALVAGDMKTAERAKITMLHFSGIDIARKSAGLLQSIGNASDPVPTKSLKRSADGSDSEDDPFDVGVADIDQRVQAMSGLPPKGNVTLLRRDHKLEEKDKRGCPNMAFSPDGKCKRLTRGDKCNFLHDRPAVEAAHEYYSKALLASPYNKSKSHRVSGVQEDSDDDSDY